MYPYKHSHQAPSIRSYRDDLQENYPGTIFSTIFSNFSQIDTRPSLSSTLKMQSTIEPSQSSCRRVSSYKDSSARLHNFDNLACDDARHT